MLRASHIAAITASVLASAAFAAPMNDSINWEGQYNGNSAPDVESGFTGEGFASGFTSVVGDGTARLNNLSQNQAASFGWWGKNVGFNLTTGASLEARVKVNDPGVGANGQWIVMRDNNNVVTLRFFGAQLQVDMDGTFGFQTVEVDPLQWHTYRIAAAAGAGNAQLYIDDVPATLDHNTLGSAAYGAWPLYFGDVTTADGETCDWSFDYLRWTTQGAFAPSVPEPACLGGAAFALATGLLRRRTHRN